MEELFDKVLKHRLEEKPKSILILCKSVERTTIHLRDYLRDKDISVSKGYGNRIVIGGLEVGIQYVRENDNWLECLLGTVWNHYYSSPDLHLSRYQKEFVESRIRPEYNRREAIEPVRLKVTL